MLCVIKKSSCLLLPANWLIRWCDKKTKNRFEFLVKTTWDRLSHAFDFIYYEQKKKKRMQVNPVSRSFKMSIYLFNVSALTLIYEFISHLPDIALKLKIIVLVPLRRYYLNSITRIVRNILSVFFGCSFLFQKLFSKKEKKKNPSSS